MNEGEDNIENREGEDVDESTLSEELRAELNKPCVQLDTMDNLLESKCRYLAKCCTVQELLVHVHYTYSRLASLRTLIERNTSMQSLSMRCGISRTEPSANITELLQAVSVNRGIKSIQVSGVISYASERALGEVVKGNGTLAEIDVQLCSSNMLVNLCGALMNNTYLSKLALTFLWGTDVPVDPIQILLQQNSTIKTFVLRHILAPDFFIPGFDLSLAMRGLLYNSSVMTLELNKDCRVEIKLMCEIFVTHPTLKSLSLTIYSYKDTLALADALAGNQTLKMLSLSFVGSFEKSLLDLLAVILGALYSGISRLESLQIKDFGNWRHSSTLASSKERVQHSLHGCSSLHSLALMQPEFQLGDDFDDDDDNNAVNPVNQQEQQLENQVDDNDNDDAVNLVNHQNQQLDDNNNDDNAMNIQNQHYWQETLDTVLVSLCGRTSVQEFCLSKPMTNWEADGAQSLLAMVAQTSSVKKLVLDDYTLNQEDFDLLARALRDNSCIEMLHFQKINIESTEEFGRTLAETNHIVALDLRELGDPEDPEESDRIVQGLISGLARNNSVEFLNFSNCDSTVGGVRDVVGCIVNSTTLKEISLECRHMNELADDELEALANSIERNGNVQKISGLRQGKFAEKACYFASLNKAGRMSYLEAENMSDSDWIKAVKRFEDCGGLSALYFALRAKPTFVFVRRTASEHASAHGVAKPKRNEDYA